LTNARPEDDHTADESIVDREIHVFHWSM
jgi:hypothetical protein